MGQAEKVFLNKGGSSLDMADAEAASGFSQALTNACTETGKISRVLIIPPDITRFHSHAGFLTQVACRFFAESGITVTILPALGTHVPLSAVERERMFPGLPENLFRVHSWRSDVAELGRLEREWIEAASENAVSYDWPVQVNKLLCSGGFDLIVSIGQVVPHEVAGMANHAKNLFVGTGGKEAIDKSHFAGAAYGMEKIMGRADTPVRAMFDEGLKRFGSMLPPVFFALTVIGARNADEAAAAGKAKGSLALRGLYCGYGRGCFTQAAALAQQVNVTLLDEPVHKALVFLDPGEYHTTWLGNKAIYRTRMAMAAGGELLIIAPALERFGEDMEIDALIRTYGYRPAEVIREKIASNKELAQSLSAAAHLIHGCSEGRFTVRYCTGSGLSRQEIESVGFEWGDIGQAVKRYDIASLDAGWNTGTDGERFFFVPNPALGLWAHKDAFI
ncbi:MAG: lactate racemase domain-containing protein [Treponema sp.]|nr:lactate racemase domain-containing protein [Treponema sp.]